MKDKDWVIFNPMIGDNFKVIHHLTTYVNALKPIGDSACTYIRRPTTFMGGIHFAIKNKIR